MFYGRESQRKTLLNMIQKEEHLKYQKLKMQMKYLKHCQKGFRDIKIF